MESNWLSEFGFKKNPYDTFALSSEEGDKLLVGRKKETDFLTQKIISSSMIPLLYGENGVGKSSIANVVAYRLSQEYNSGNERYFFLNLKNQESTLLSDPIRFEKSIYQEIIAFLLDNKAFLIERGIKRREIARVHRSTQRMESVERGGGIGMISISLANTPNPFAQERLPIIAREWLEKCFGNRYSGGIICVIDNLENSGTSSQVKKLIESMRDTVFAIPGLLWIFCGTPTVVEGIRNSKLLQGYIAEMQIFPIDENEIPKVIEQRIAYFGDVNVDPPVNKELFKAVYAMVNKQLRVAFTLCQEFAAFLFDYPMWRNDDRTGVFKSWIDQLAVELPEREYEITDESWELFDRVVLLGSDISSDDLKLLNISDIEELKRVALPLKSHGLLEIIDTDDGFLLSISRNGWLVNYKRKNYRIGEGFW